MKLGLIKVSDEAIKTKNMPEVFYKLGVTPIEIFGEPYTTLKIYKCIGDCFDDVPNGELIKEYTPTISIDEKGELTVKL